MYSKDLEICAYLQQKSWLLLWSSPHQVLYIIQYCCLLVQPLQGQFTRPFYSRSFDPLPWLHIWCHYCLVQPSDPYQFSTTALFLIPSITLLLKLGCSLWKREWVRHHINKRSESIDIYIGLPAINMTHSTANYVHVRPFEYTVVPK